MGGRSDREVPSRDAKLISEIERDALDSRTPIGDALRKCLALGGSSNSGELRSWASRELRGYNGPDPLPEYRRIRAPIMIDGINGRYQIRHQPISTTALPDFARDRISEDLELRQPVARLEDLARGAREKGEAIRLSLPGAAELARVMDAASGNPYQQIHALYWSIDATALASVCDNVRTSLIELVAELRRGMRDPDGPLPTDVASSAVGVAVYGQGSTVVVGNAAATSGPQSRSMVQQSPGFGRSKVGVAAAIAGIITILAALAKLAEALGFIHV